MQPEQRPQPWALIARWVWKKYISKISFLHFPHHAALLPSLPVFSLPLSQGILVFPCCLISHSPNLLQHRPQGCDCSGDILQERFPSSEGHSIPVTSLSTGPTTGKSHPKQIPPITGRNTKPLELSLGHQENSELMADPPDLSPRSIFVAHCSHEVTGDGLKDWFKGM